MRLPKLTRTRFILLWCAGIVTFFLIGWKFILKKDELVANIQRIPVTDIYWDGEVRHIHQIGHRPSSAVDFMDNNNASRLHQNFKGLGAVQRSQPVEGSDSEEENERSSEDSSLSASPNDSERKTFKGFDLWKMQNPEDAARTKDASSRTKLLPPDNSAEEVAKSGVVSDTNEENTPNKDKVGMFKQKQNTPSLPERNQIPSRVGFRKEDDILLEPHIKEPQIVLSNGNHVQSQMLHQNLEREFNQHLNLQPVHPTSSSLKIQTAPAERNSQFHPEVQHVQNVEIAQRHEVVADSNTEHSLITIGKQQGSQYREKETPDPEKENVRFENNEIGSRTVSAHHPRISNVDKERLANTISMKVDEQAFREDQPLNPPNVILNQPTRQENVRTGNPVSTWNSYNVGNVPHQTVVKQAPVEVMPARKPVLLRGDAVNRKVRPEDETDQEFLQRMEERQAERHARIRQQCQSKYGLSLLDFQRDRQKILSWKKYFEHAYANDDHQFIICRVLKVASFSWRKVMISLYGKGSQAFRRSQKQGDFPMMDYDDAKFISKLENYKRILFVRDPLARLLSGYRDKYIELRHFPYYQPIGMKIIRKYRRNPSQAEIMSGRPTFEEFTRWVIAEETPLGDFHWRPLFNVYHPCEINYDYIGKLETAAEDAKYIFKMIGIEGIETFPSTETHHTFSSSTNVLEEFYSQLPPELLPKLIERYREEFELFDYPIPQQFSDMWTRAET